jgi:hypothetical protein
MYFFHFRLFSCSQLCVRDYYFALMFLMFFNNYFLFVQWFSAVHLSVPRRIFIFLHKFSFVDLACLSVILDENHYC